MHNEPLITQREIHHLLANKKTKIPLGKKIKLFFNELFIIAIVFVISYSIVNWPAVSDQLNYWWEVDYLNKPSVSAKPIILPPQIPINESKMLIPKIGVEADILWDIPLKNSRPYLDKGIVHIADTAHPDEIGNIFIAGHSSNYVWVKSKYQSIFSLIDKLLAGDKITVTYKGTAYQYTVIDSKIVKPTDISVLAPTPEPILSIMTCYPVGTSNKRLVVRAKLTSPKLETMNIPSALPSHIKNLPGFR